VSAAPAEPDDLSNDLDDLLPDDLLAPKKAAVPLKRTPKQLAAAARAAAVKAEADALAAQAARLAQIVNLHIAGYSLEAIGAAIGATGEEVDRMLANEAARYVRNQPQLRTYVRNFISGKYTSLLEAVWDGAVDKKRSDQLEHVDRAQRILAQMGRLHGAEAPTQSEVKVEAAPEAVERLVSALAASSGMGYDTSIFDTVPGEVVHDAVVQTHAALEVSRNQVEEPQEGEPDDGF
jgi:hypothetical protein